MYNVRICVLCVVCVLCVLRFPNEVVLRLNHKILNTVYIIILNLGG